MKQQNLTITIFLAISIYSSIIPWMSNFTEHGGIILLILNTEKYLLIPTNMLKILDDQVVSEPVHTAFTIHSNTTWSLPASNLNRQFLYFFFFCSTCFAALNQLICEDTPPLNISTSLLAEGKYFPRNFGNTGLCSHKLHKLPAA